LFLGAEHGRLLLGAAHEQHAFPAAERRAMLGRDVVLPLPLGEREQRDVVPFGKVPDGGDKGFADRRQESG